ncbi:Protein disulfide-isomerase [[Candida] zeylanoides]
MQFWKFTVPVLATLLAAVSASGPADGEAAADPNSAVVKLTAADFASFIGKNPLVLAEFFAPWCGYCKILGPEFSSAADTLAETHSDKIQLAQIDCTEEEELCSEHGIRGYPSLKLIRGGDVGGIEDYDGPRSADGIVEYMIQQTLPVVQAPLEVEELEKLATSSSKPVVFRVSSVGNDNETEAETFADVASTKRKDAVFVTVSEPKLVDALGKFLPKSEISAKNVAATKYYLVRPNDLENVSVLVDTFSPESLTAFIETEVVPYFGEINRDTYMLYMNSPLPIGYYFYNDEAQKKAVESVFNKLGKAHRGKINFVGLDATMFGRHAEILNMDPEVVPLFAIQKVADNLKYGINQTQWPEGPSAEAIEEFVAAYVAGELTPIVKSEDLPTAEEVSAAPVVKLVGHNHEQVVKDNTKDVFVKYYAPWCGHCKTLAPKWEELAGIFGSNQPNADVVIAHIDHTANDVETPFQIEGYPTLVLYPANGEIDEATGFRKPIIFDKAREVDDLIEFIHTKGGHKVDGTKLRAAWDAAQAKAAEAAEAAADAASNAAGTAKDAVEDAVKAAEEAAAEHDEL